MGAFRVSVFLVIFALVCLTEGLGGTVDFGKGGTYLMRPTTAVIDANAMGSIRWKHSLPSDSDRVVFTAKNLDATKAYSVSMETFQESEILVAIGALAPIPKKKTHKLVFEKSVTGLPFGAEKPVDLFARRIEVRDPTGALVLFGFMPGNGYDPLNGKWYGGVSFFNQPSRVIDPDAEGKIVWKKKPQDGRSKFVVELYKLSPGKEYGLFIGLSMHELKFVANLEPVAGSQATHRFSVDTKFGDPLPLGVAQPHYLEYVEVRSQNGDIVLGGYVSEGNY